MWEKEVKVESKVWGLSRRIFGITEHWRGKTFGSTDFGSKDSFGHC